MPYGDKNQNVDAPWATPLETFSMESTKRCSFACYVFFFLPLKCQIRFHERKCGDTLRHFKGAQLFPKSLVASFLLNSIENRKRDRGTRPVHEWDANAKVAFTLGIVYR